MTTNSRGGRIGRLEQQWDLGGFCQTCRDGTLTRLVMAYDDHDHELRPEFCPDCGTRAEHTLVIDLTTKDDDQERTA